MSVTFFSTWASHVFLLLTLVACGQYQFESGKSNILGGRVLPLEGIVQSTPTSPSLFPLAYAAPSCDSTVYARLHALENDGSLNNNPILSTEVSDGKYAFGSELPADILHTFVKYQIVIEGCDQVFYRPVTDLNMNQDVTYTSTLVGHATQTQLTNPLPNSSRSEIEFLINRNSGASILQAYNNLDSNPELNTKFQNIFSDVPAKLVLSHPSVSVLNFPNMINEALPSTFKVSALHFDPAYPIGYEWHLDGVLKGNLNQWVFTPSADSAGTYVVSVFVGHSNGSGGVDRTKPFYFLSRTITIINTVPATPPSFTLASSFTQDGSISAVVNTGVLKTNCESFEYFLMTEGTATPSATHPGFTRAC